MYRSLVFIIVLGLFASRHSQAIDYAAQINKAKSDAENLGRQSQSGWQSNAKNALQQAATANGASIAEVEQYLAQTTGNSAGSFTNTNATFTDTATVNGGSTTAASSGGSQYNGNVNSTYSNSGGAGSSDQRAKLNRVLNFADKDGLTGVATDCVMEFGQRNAVAKANALGIVPSVVARIMANGQNLTVADTCAYVLSMSGLSGIETLRAVASGQPVRSQTTQYDPSAQQQQLALQIAQAQQRNEQAVARQRFEAEKAAAIAAKQKEEDDAMMVLLAYALGNKSGSTDVSQIFQLLQQAK